jgi:hypothetical protein
MNGSTEPYVRENATTGNFSDLAGGVGDTTEKAGAFFNAIRRVSLKMRHFLVIFKPLWTLLRRCGQFGITPIAHVAFWILFFLVDNATLPRFNT